MSDVLALHDARSGEGSGSSGTDETETINVSAPVATPEEGTSVGTTVSRYVVLEEIGRGGMGRVLRAYDPKLQREVALKEVRETALGSDGAARLVEEARAMAKLSHPNVVAVYDVEELSTPQVSGEARGRIDEQPRVVLVMEYVPGKTLRQWLREQTRPWREVMQRFLAAGRGLVAAHEAGLLHRDFKPANVLVDGDNAKVTDFGLAQLGGTMSPQGRSGVEGSTPVGTGPGVVMGTPRYMAPEQHRDEHLTSAADQYAFCIALWEALCNEPPFAGRTMVEDKLSGPPPWPASSIPRPIASAIVRGLSPRPGDRWPSMQALLETLSWDPARRRNRWLLGLGTLGVLGLAGMSYEAWADARRQRCSGAKQQLAGIWDETRSTAVQSAILGIGKSYAPDVWARTQRELDAYAGDWATMYTEACEATAVRGEQSPQMLDLRMGCLHRAAQELRATVETLTDADDKVVQNAHKLTTGLRPLSRCADTEALAAEVEPPLPEEIEAVDAVRLQLARAESLDRAGHYQAAQNAVEAAKEALVGVEYGPVQTEVALREGSTLDSLGDYEASEAALKEALRLAAQWRQTDAIASAALRLMYVVGYRQHRMEEALRYHPLTQGLSRGLPEQEAASRHHLAIIMHAQGDYAEAEAEYRAALSLRAKALGADHPEVAASRNNLAAVLYDRGAYMEAEAEHRAALSVWEEALGPEHPNSTSSRNNLAAVLHAQGKYAEAEAEVRAAPSLKEKVLGPDHPDVATSRNNLANVLYEQRKFAEAEAEVRAALSLKEKVLGPDHFSLAVSRNNLANALRAQGKYAEAEAEYRAALSLREEVLGSDHPSVAASRINLALVLTARGKYAEAEAEYRTALSVCERELDSDHPHTTTARHNLADVLVKLGRTAEALPLAEEAWDRRKRDDIPTEQRAETAFVLARISWSIEGPARDRSRARQLAEEARESFREAGDAFAENARDVQHWLDIHRPQ